MGQVGLRASMTAMRKAVMPIARWSSGVSSSFVCDRPAIDEVNTIAVGTTRAISDASCSAPLGTRMVSWHSNGQLALGSGWGEGGSQEGEELGS